MTWRGGSWWRLTTGAVVVAALAAVLAAGLTPRDAASPRADLPVTRTLDQPVPDLSGKTLHGNDFDMSELRGRIVVINVMASWCAPCREELPELAEAAHRWPPDEVQVIGLAMRDDPDDAMQLLHEAGAADLTVLADPDGTHAVSLGVRGVPETFLVDRGGTVRLHAFGPVTFDWLARHLPPLGAT